MSTAPDLGGEEKLLGLLIRGGKWQLALNFFSPSQSQPVVQA